MSEGSRGDGSNDRLTLTMLGLAAMVCIIGIVILAAFRVDSQPLVAIASASVGALATKITGNNRSERKSDAEDDFAILGRAATKSIIAEAMRQMGAKE